MCGLGTTIYRSHVTPSDGEFLEQPEEIHALFSRRKPLLAREDDVYCRSACPLDNFIQTKEQGNASISKRRELWNLYVLER